MGCFYEFIGRYGKRMAVLQVFFGSLVRRVGGGGGFFWGEKGFLAFFFGGRDFWVGGFFG